MESRLAHHIYFSLTDNSEAQRSKLLAACKKYLADHPGILSFAVGVVADDLARPVNDLDFDVALQIVFVDKAAHDRYQSAEKHLRFMEESKANWRQVRVFDARLAAY